MYLQFNHSVTFSIQPRNIVTAVNCIMRILHWQKIQIKEIDCLIILHIKIPRPRSAGNFLDGHGNFPSRHGAAAIITLGKFLGDDFM